MQTSFFGIALREGVKSPKRQLKGPFWAGYIYLQTFFVIQGSQRTRVLIFRTGILVLKNVFLKQYP